MIRNSSKDLDKLVKQAMNGNDAAFKEIVNLKCESILFSIMNILGSYENVEDVARIVVAEVYKNIKQLGKPENFNVWLHKIIIKQCHIKQEDAVKADTNVISEFFTGTGSEERETLTTQMA